MPENKKLKIWKYEERHTNHALVKLYAEAHGEGEYLGEFTDDEAKELIRGIKSDVKVDKELHRLKYFGFLPILVIYKSGSPER